MKKRLRREELKQKQIGPVVEDDGKRALAVGCDQKRYPKSKLTCKFCGRKGHFKRECWKWAAEKKKSEQTTGSSQKQSASAAEVLEAKSSSEDDDTDGDNSCTLNSIQRKVDSGLWKRRATCAMTESNSLINLIRYYNKRLSAL